MTIYLIRHTSVDVPQGVCYGQTDVPLKLSFMHEAEETFKQIEHIRFDKVFTSPLTRCIRLATYCGHPEAIRDKRIMEINLGDWEMQKYDEITDPNLQAWYEDYFHVRATHGESFEDLYLRIADFLDELRQQPYNQVAVFAHGGVLLSALIYAGVLKKEEALKNLPPYGGIVKIEL